VSSGLPLLPANSKIHPTPDQFGLVPSMGHFPDFAGQPDDFDNKGVFCWRTRMGYYVRIVLLYTRTLIFLIMRNDIDMYNLDCSWSICCFVYVEILVGQLEKIVCGKQAEDSKHQCWSYSIWWHVGPGLLWRFALFVSTHEYMWNRYLTEILSLDDSASLDQVIWSLIFHWNAEKRVLGKSGKCYNCFILYVYFR